MWNEVLILKSIYSVEAEPLRVAKDEFSQEHVFKNKTDK